MKSRLLQESFFPQERAFLSCLSAFGVPQEKSLCLAGQEMTENKHLLYFSGSCRQDQEHIFGNKSQSLPLDLLQASSQEPQHHALLLQAQSQVCQSHKGRLEVPVSCLN